MSYMKLWTQLLPFFIVKWWAKKNCEQFTYVGINEVLGKTITVVQPFKDTQFRIRK